MMAGFGVNGYCARKCDLYRWNGGRTNTLSAWAASSWVAPRKLMPLTVNSWSPRFSSPPTSAGPPANINDTNIPWPSSPPTMLNPSPCGPFCMVIVRCSLRAHGKGGGGAVRKATKPLYLQMNWKMPHFRRHFVVLLLKLKNHNQCTQHFTYFFFSFLKQYPFILNIATIQCQPFIWF